jgi:hypothetical protein
MKTLPPTLVQAVGWAVLLGSGALAAGQEPLNRDYSELTVLPEAAYAPWFAAPGGLASPGEIDLVLEDGDLVLGVVIGEEARAYPIGFFWGPAHEILNDTLGGTPVAPSW